MLQVEDVAGEVAEGMLLAPFTNIIEMDLGTKATHVPTHQPESGEEGGVRAQFLLGFP